MSSTPVSTVRFLDAGTACQPLRQRNAAALDADQDQVCAAIALFNNLVARRTNVRSTSEADINLPDAQGFAFTRSLIFSCLAVAASLSQDGRGFGRASKLWRTKNGIQEHRQSRKSGDHGAGRAIRRRNIIAQTSGCRVRPIRAAPPLPQSQTTAERPN